MKKILFLILLTVAFYQTKSQVKNMPQGSTFYDFMEAYKQQNTDTSIKDKHIERPSKMWTPRLSPDGNSVDETAIEFRKIFNREDWFHTL